MPIYNDELSRGGVRGDRNAPRPEADMSICPECYIAAHYSAEEAVQGQYDTEEETRARQTEIEQGFARYEGYTITGAIDEHGDNPEHFSKSSCPICNQGLGGGRYDVHVHDNRR